MGSPTWNSLARNPGYRAYCKKVVANLGLKGHEVVLDFGCGTGLFSQHFVRALSKGGFLTCLDIDDKMLSEAKKKLSWHSNVEFVLGDILEASVKENYYDLVFVHYTLHQVQEDRRQNVVNALSRKLRCDGTLYIVEPLEHQGRITKEDVESYMRFAGLKEIQSGLDDLVSQMCSAMEGICLSDNEKTEILEPLKSPHYIGRYVKICH